MNTHAGPGPQACLGSDTTQEIAGRSNLQVGIAGAGVKVVSSFASVSAQPAAAAPSCTGVAARITRCRHGQPLVVLDDRPFNGLEIYPHDLERLGQQLVSIARLAKQHTGKRETTVVMG